MISNIFYALAKLHIDTGWDVAVGETFQKIGDELKANGL